MREIKFRAWDRDNKRMIYIGGDWDYSFIDHCIYRTEENDQVVETVDNIELMQYTGFKDKNGKDIYEGDIVISNYADCHGVVTYGSFGGCEYCGSAYGYVIKGMGLVGPDINLPSELTIIGNIYEHPNLLKEVK